MSTFGTEQVVLMSFLSSSDELCQTNKRSEVCARNPDFQSAEMIS